MECKKCGNKLKVKKRKVKVSNSFISIPVIIEFVGLALMVSPYMYQPLAPFQNIMLAVGFIVALIGHFTTYKKVPYHWCNGCKSEFEINET